MSIYRQGISYVYTINKHRKAYRFICYLEIQIYRRMVTMVKKQYIMYNVLCTLPYLLIFVYMYMYIYIYIFIYIYIYININIYIYIYVYIYCYSITRRNIEFTYIFSKFIILIIYFLIL